MNSRKYEDAIKALFPNNGSGIRQISVYEQTPGQEAETNKVYCDIHFDNVTLCRIAKNVFKPLTSLIPSGNTDRHPNEFTLHDSITPEQLVITFDRSLLNQTNENFKALQKKINDFYQQEVRSANRASSSSSSSSSAASSASVTPTTTSAGSAGGVVKPIARRPNLFQQNPPTSQPDSTISQQELRKEDRQNNSSNPDSKRRKGGDDSGGSTPAP